MTEKKLENLNVPTYLQPTARLVNATLQEVEDGLASQARQDRGLSKSQQALLKVLSSEVYDGIKITAFGLHRSLEPFSKEYVGYGIDSKFKGLVTDLEYVQLLETGGLEAINGRVKELFESSGTEMTYEQRKEVMGKINDILGRAIYLFPHLARGVEVRLKPGAEARTKEFEDKFGWLDYYRNRYNMLLEAYQKKKSEPLPNSLILPLPYGFTTGTHGSGERAAMGASWEDVCLDFIHPHNDWQTKVPTLAVVLETPLITRHSTYFTLDEVESIQFTHKGEFTPYVDSEDVLVEKGSPETYYLRFRDFTNKSAFRNQEHLSELTDEEWRKVNREIISARAFSNLWKEDYSTKPRTLKKGFIASWGDNPNNVTLYELTNVELPKEETDEAIAVLYTRILKGDKSVIMHTREYKGNNIMRRLAEIPVAERHF